MQVSPSNPSCTIAPGASAGAGPDSDSRTTSQPAMDGFTDSSNAALSLPELAA